MFKLLNGTYKDCEKVIDISVNGDVAIKTMKATYHAQSVIIAAGNPLCITVYYTGCFKKSRLT